MFDRTGIKVNRNTAFTMSYKRPEVVKRGGRSSRDETRHIEKVGLELKDHYRRIYY